MSKMRHTREVELLEASVPDNNNEYRPYRLQPVMCVPIGQKREQRNFSQTHT